VPWCETCGQGLDKDQVQEDGTCPFCGEEATEHRAMPLRFKLMIWATVIYLAYRAYQGIAWVVHHA
jgi:hypothetical protein